MDSPTATAQSQEQVQRILEQASYFVIFSLPDPESLSRPVPLVPFVEELAYQIDLTEVPRRLRITTRPPTAECGFRSRKEIGRQIADQTLVMQVVPNDFESGPGREPPPTLLIPVLSQRFWMSDGSFSFLDGRESGFSAVAGGRFFPLRGFQLWVGGVGDILTGRGALEGFTGCLVIAGLTTPPDRFANAFFFRFPDPAGALRAAELPPLVADGPDPDYSSSALISLVSEPRPGTAPEIGPGPDGKKRVRIVERLRLADTDIDVRPGFLESKTTLGEVVGERRSTLVFDPGDPGDTIPMFSTGGEFTFWAGEDRIGTLRADLQEARAFRATAPGLEGTYFRYGGFGLLGEGTGQFEGLTGMIAVNGALSLDPWATSSMVLLRILDPQGSFRSPGDDGRPRAVS